MDAKGKNFLKVTGILMVIGAAISIIVYLIVLLAGTCATVAAGEIGAIILVAGIIGLIAAVIELIAGILGIKNCKDPAKANSCLVFGIIVLIIEIISLILNLVGSSDNGAATIIVTIICGVAVPVLYIIGAVLNKKQA